jgi:hypothetical protein
MNKIIEKQIAVANKLINEFEVIDPNCIIAGGAPRNWYFGKPANDLDLYVYTPDKTYTERKKRLKHTTVKNLKSLTKESGEMYACMKHLKTVYSGEYLDMPVNIMFMGKPTFDSVVNHFGTSICKTWYKSGSCINLETEFLVGEFFKRIYVANDYNAKVAHVSKMEKYFPDYEFVNHGIYEFDYQVWKETFKDATYDERPHHFVNILNENPQYGIF